MFNVHPLRVTIRIGITISEKEGDDEEEHSAKKKRVEEKKEKKKDYKKKEERGKEGKAFLTNRWLAACV